MKYTISIADLEAAEACASARILFMSIFGNGPVEVNEENATKAWGGGLVAQESWLAANFLNEAGIKELNRLSLIYCDHSSSLDGNGCAGCLTELHNFVKLFNDDRYRRIE